VLDNPYVMVSHAGRGGAAFSAVDAVCRREPLSVDDFDPRRLDVMLALGLKRGMQFGGHTAMSAEHTLTACEELFYDEGPVTLDRLAARVAALRERAAESSLLEAACRTKHLRVVSDCVGGADVLYRADLHADEKAVAEYAARHAAIKTDEAPSEAAVAAALAGFFGDGREPDSLQLKAVNHALTRKLSLLAGVPGGGKSAAVAMIVSAIRSLNRDPGCTAWVLAFTGAAVARVKELLREFNVSTDHIVCCTVHSFLGRCKYHPDIARAARHVIVDESSMLSLRLASDLFLALQGDAQVATANVVLVGDPNQLPSIDPGCVFRDLLEVGRAAIVMLVVPYRNAGPIAENAQRILAGEPIAFEEAGACRHVQVNADMPEASVCNAVVAELLKNYPPSAPRVRHSLPGAELPAVLARTRTAVGRLNRALQAQYNPPADDGSKQITAFFGKDSGCESTVRLHDRVVNLRNVTKADLDTAGITLPNAPENTADCRLRADTSHRNVNGDCGHVVAIDQLSRKITVRFDDGSFLNYGPNLRPYDTLSLAYAVTVHKSQGSQYDEVYAVLPPHLRLMDRSILYTAWTRSKKQIVVFGAADQLHTESTMTSMTHSRRGHLQWRILQL